MFFFLYIILPGEYLSQLYYRTMDLLVLGEIFQAMHRIIHINHNLSLVACGIFAVILFQVGPSLVAVLTF